MQSPISRTARVLAALAEKKGEGAAAPVSEEAAVSLSAQWIHNQLLGNKNGIR
jgi:large subunit ribosomal protein L10